MNLFFYKLHIMKTFFRKIKTLLFIPLFMFGINACKPETEYIYEINNVEVQQEGGTKSHLKTNTEFISIAYQDLFGSTIPSSELLKLNQAYSSFGDRKLIEDMIIRNFLNNPSVNIPTKQTMKNNVSAFIKSSYTKFYNRSANEFEHWQLMNTINNDTSITPELIYYSLMTADEYRYY